MSVCVIIGCPRCLYVKKTAVYVFVADLQASVYVRDISSVKCIRDIRVSEICMFMYMRYI